MEALCVSKLKWNWLTIQLSVWLLKNPQITYRSPPKTKSYLAAGEIESHMWSSGFGMNAPRWQQKRWWELAGGGGCELLPPEPKTGRGKKQFMMADVLEISLVAVSATGCHLSVITT